MRLNVVNSKNAASLYVIKSVRENGRNTTKIVEKLGTEAELREKLSGRDPYEWANEYIEQLNIQEKEASREVLIKKSPIKRIDKDERKLWNGGYLFLQDIYHSLKLDKICADISMRHQFDYDLNSILSRLIYARILFPCSKLSTMEVSKDFLEKPNFELHQIYRALNVIAEESDFIESEVYKNSLAVAKRQTGVLYYDCTNFFFEIEKACGIKQYGVSKENRPNPIVQMGLFMDGEGIPLAFCIYPGNQNEQGSLKPLEKRILSDFNLSKFIVCTDAGLSSVENRRYNTLGSRAYVVTQPIKKLKAHLKEWVLDPHGWSLSGSNKQYDLTEIDDFYANRNTYYKSRWIKENDIEERLIVTFSPRNRAYQREVRRRQIERAIKSVEHPSSTKRHKQNDYKRFISSTYVTDDGEVAETELLQIDSQMIAKEEMFDGFYAVTTSLEDEPEQIIKINHGRWQIEECFRIMKSEFEARPVYLRLDMRIKAHFMTCFLSLLVYRLLEKRLGNKYTVEEIIDTLSSFMFSKVPHEGYEPQYTRTDLTDDLHEAFGFRSDFQIVPEKNMKKIFRQTKT